MIKRIAHEIAERIRGEAWADRVAGVVIAHKYIGPKGEKISVPISCDLSGPNCTEDQLGALLPDARRRSIVFIEDRSGARRIGVDGPWVNFQGILRVVAWLNLEQMGIVDSDCQGCSTGHKVSQRIFSLLPPRNFNIDDCNIVALNIDHYGFEKVGDNPWKDYTVAEDRRALMLPGKYEYFAMDLVCQWKVHDRCLGSVVVNDPLNCGAPVPVRRRFPKDFSCEELTDGTTGLTDEQYDCLGCEGGDPCPLTIMVTVNGVAQTPLTDVDPCVDNTISITLA